ncbi:Peptidyl-prolyl cis-trans isomerase FKBP62 [Dendrobium catenatum]|uniref:peptidylprolyl isomerase n=1 Tax=Dendrobium catenatum TaxID=906689 RepID=A0A2I0X574_9ASPA|nr:Peptidyl-prolyl cis-trans isomerase FKBP62 [Dendrobium catenatum]
MPHVLKIHAGGDVAETITAFAPACRIFGVCVLSASGPFAGISVPLNTHSQVIKKMPYLLFPLSLLMELLSWSSVKDICKDGGIFKKILEGEKWENQKDLDEVLIKYEASLEDGTVISKVEAAEFTVKEGFFCPALSKAVKTMKKVEKVLLTVKPQCES